MLLVHDEVVERGYGAEAYVRRLADGLRDLGDTVSVMAGERRRRGAAKVLDVWDPQARRMVAARARDFAPDVINFHNITRELSASVLGAAPQVPAVLTLHDRRLFGAREHRFAGPRRMVEAAGAVVVMRAARTRLSATIGVSNAVSALAAAAGLPAVATVPVPAADPVGVLVPAAQCHDVVVVARLAADKGIDVVIDAFASVAADVGSSRLVIAGDGPQRDALQRRARSLGNRVSFLGWLDETELSGLLGRSRIVVVASIPGRRPEGSSLAAVEAAAHGRAVIGCDDPAVAEAVTALGAGPVVPAGDARVLARELSRLLSDDAAVTAYAESAAVGARAYSPAAVAAATREVYRAAIDGGGC
ncbi:MAG TPA: glycosyltransferase family 4 protein [Mycobacteriales bacterium]|nr:glycosyltransferase family 4 protein [Mycobacteriales bacterium]HWC34234.1 glycosyltransferase family 4 protein [Mycobacteriales bacterium]